MSFQFNPFTGKLDKTIVVDGTASVSAIPDGTASLPGIAFASDTNTGIYHPGPDQLAISTGGNGRLFVNSSGQVKIGLNTGSDLLDVVADSASLAGTRISNINGDSAAGARLGLDSAGGSWSISNYRSGAPLVFDNGNERLRITSAGLVGIGTSSPSYQLEVNSDVTDATALFNSTSANGSHIRFARSGTVDGYLGCSEGFLNALTPGDIAVRSQGALGLATGGANTRLYINSSGLVGIGTSSPGAALDVRARDLHLGATSGGAGLITFRRNSGAQSGYFGWDAGSDTVMRWGNDSGSGRLAFNTNGTEKARIDENGRLLVGTSNARQFTLGGAGYAAQIQFAGSSIFTASSLLTRDSDDTTGYTLYLGKSRATSIGSFANVIQNDQLGTIVFGGANEGFLRPGADISAFVDGEPSTGGDTTDMPGRLVFSTTADGASSPTERMRITSDGYARLSANSGGIQFNGDSAAANALDDYEEGTWTPTFVPQTGSFTSITYDSTRAGHYTKIGNCVTVWGVIRTDSVDTTGASGLLAIGGLPFSVGTGTQGGGFATSLLNWAGEDPSAVRPLPGETFAYLSYRTAIDGADTLSDVSDLTTGTADANRVAFQFSYRV